MKNGVSMRTLPVLVLCLCPLVAGARNQEPTSALHPSNGPVGIPQGPQDIAQICALLELPTPETQKTNTPRISVTTRGGAVLYNPYALTNAAYWGGPWAPIGLLAREVGRLAAPQTNCLQGAGERLTDSQRADFVAGFVLGRMGASLQDALRAVEATAVPGDVSEQMRADRSQVVERGWQKSLMR